MPGQFESVLFNFREEGKSADVNLLQRLISAQVQNILRDGATGQPTIGSGPYGGMVNDAGPMPNMINLSEIGTGSGPFDVLVHAGEAWVQSTTNLESDQSDYQILRWPETNLTLDDPDPSSGRIDLIYTVAGTLEGEIDDTRNILTDPGTRSTAPQNVAKRLTPNVIVQVQTGAPAFIPQPPDSLLPADAVVLFEVFVPAAAVDSSSFKPTRRIWRRVEGPLAAWHGIISGCHLVWGAGLESAGDSALVFHPGTINKIILNGEHLTWSGNTMATIYADQDNNPWDGPPPSIDTPYYIYLVGGRFSPRALNANGIQSAPVIIVESLTAPDNLGRPVAPLNTNDTSRPNPAQPASCLYIGIGFRATSGYRKSCRIAGDWVYAQTGGSSGRVGFTRTADVIPAIGATGDIDISDVCPVPSSEADVGFWYKAPAPIVSHISFQSYPPLAGITNCTSELDPEGELGTRDISVSEITLRIHYAASGSFTFRMQDRNNSVYVLNRSIPSSSGTVGIFDIPVQVDTGPAADPGSGPITIAPYSVFYAANNTTGSPQIAGVEWIVKKRNVLQVFSAIGGATVPTNLDGYLFSMVGQGAFTVDDVLDSDLFVARRLNPRIGLVVYNQTTSTGTISNAFDTRLIIKPMGFNMNVPRFGAGTSWP